MTSVMRALGAPATPRVLRIGLVREGRIREERILEKHASVSVGRDEGATFVVDDVVARVAVIERDLGAYFLNLRAPITGRVEIEGAVHEIAALRQASGHRIRLDESSRGRIAVGGATLLFQFVPAPPHAPKPQLPLAVRQGVALDAGLLVVAAFSLLLHFGVVGAMYSDWSDPIVDDAITVGALLDLGHHDLVWTDPAPHPADPATKSEAPSHDAAPHDAHGSQHASPTPHAPPGASHFDALAREAQAMSMGILTATHAGSAVAAALARDLPPVDLTDAAKQAGGVTNAGDDLHMTANAFVAPTGHGLDRIAGGAVNDSGAHAHAVDVKPPPVVTTFEPPSSSAPMPKAEQVIARLRGQIRRCYERGLAVDPSMAGSLVVRAKVAANGEVDHAVAASVVGLSSDVTGCIVRTIAGATFDQTPSGSTLDVPVKMVQQSH